MFNFILFESWPYSLSACSFFSVCTIFWCVAHSNVICLLFILKGFFPFYITLQSFILFYSFPSFIDQAFNHFVFFSAYEVLRFQHLSPWKLMEVKSKCCLSFFFLPENQKPPKDQLHSHTTSTRQRVPEEFHCEADVNSSVKKSKAIGRKDGAIGSNKREKEVEFAGVVSKGETMPEVEALLARLRAL